jgi:hypothetical protein
MKRKEVEWELVRTSDRRQQPRPLTGLQPRWRVLTVLESTKHDALHSEQEIGSCFPRRLLTQEPMLRLEGLGPSLVSARFATTRVSRIAQRASSAVPMVPIPCAASAQFTPAADEHVAAAAEELMVGVGESAGVIATGSRPRAIAVMLMWRASQRRSRNKLKCAPQPSVYTVRGINRLDEPGGPPSGDVDKRSLTDTR